MRADDLIHLLYILLLIKRSPIKCLYLVVFVTPMNYWLIIIISSHLVQYHSICILPLLLYMKSHQRLGYTVSGENYCARFFLYPVCNYILFDSSTISRVECPFYSIKINQSDVCYKDPRTIFQYPVSFNNISSPNAFHF